MRVFRVLRQEKFKTKANGVAYLVVILHCDRKGFSRGHFNHFPVTDLIHLKFFFVTKDETTLMSKLFLNLQSFNVKIIFDSLYHSLVNASQT